eukprot:gnl/MRDRNA2_/MRDRNA2_60383_c0_seq1.p1 gnl/MRDRNA2_/MRDRNA2_60383_c0~~gnl/MRDRNA2_/MRDRNA2_60383_c0_seq1.p1  ORF type:complete len:212 (-),score=41.93 gnl/MRDRNA2_/MRDRNA2_60383_c0_seq1:121-756(-)
MLAHVAVCFFALISIAEAHPARWPDAAEGSAPHRMLAMPDGTYVCTTCGLVYDPVKEGLAFTDLPDDWRCPNSGTKKSGFRPWSTDDASLLLCLNTTHHQMPGGMVMLNSEMSPDPCEICTTMCVPNAGDGQDHSKHGHDDGHDHDHAAPAPSPTEDGHDHDHADAAPAPSPHGDGHDDDHADAAKMAASCFLWKPLVLTLATLGFLRVSQ